jgi:hypothetical protein
MASEAEIQAELSKRYAERAELLLTGHALTSGRKQNFTILGDDSDKVADAIREVIQICHEGERNPPSVESVPLLQNHQLVSTFVTIPTEAMKKAHDVLGAKHHAEVTLEGPRNHHKRRPAKFMKQLTGKYDDKETDGYSVSVRTRDNIERGF